MHLTNYAINKTSPEFQKNDASDNDSTGHKRRLTFAFKYIESMGFDSKEVIHNIKDIILKTIISIIGITEISLLRFKMAIMK